MTKINQEEYEVLKNLDDKWKWIARNPFDKLWKHTFKPTKKDAGWSPDNLDEDIEIMETNLFQFVQWEDEEPYNIQELIEEYENEEFGYYIMEAARDYEQSVEKSEETEVKDLEWLKDEILTDMRYLEGNRDIRHLDIKYQTLREVAQKIISLDEPETLSQEWIDENKEMYLINDTSENAVPDYKLQNLLVPKQEEITESFKETVRKLIETSELAMDVQKLTGMTLEQIAEEARNGGIVPKQEQEQKYVIKLDDESYLQRYEIDNKNIVTPFRIVGHLKEVAIKFDNKERAEKVAELVEGKVKELEE